MLKHHPDRSTADFRCKSLPGVLCHCSIFSRIGASGEPGQFELNAGAGLIAGACLAWGIDNNLTRKLSAADPVMIAMLNGLVAGTVNTGLALWSGAALPSAGLFAAAAVVGFVGIGVSLVLFILGLRHLGAARTGAYFSLAPFIGALLAIAFLGESLTVRLAVAGALMAFGLWLHLAERHEHAHLSVAARIRVYPARSQKLARDLP